MEKISATKRIAADLTSCACRQMQCHSKQGLMMTVVKQTQSILAGQQTKYAYTGSATTEQNWCSSVPIATQIFDGKQIRTKKIICNWKPLKERFRQRMSSWFNCVHQVLRLLVLDFPGSRWNYGGVFCSCLAKKGYEVFLGRTILKIVSLRRGRKTKKNA